MTVSEILAVTCAAGGASVLGWFAADAALWVRQRWTARRGARRA